MSIDTAAGVSMTTDYANHLLYNFRLPILADAQNNSSVLMSMIQKVDRTDISGRYVTFPVLVGRNTGRGAIRPSGQLPDPGSQGAKTYATETRTIFARIKIQGEILRRGRTNGGAAIEAEILETKRQADDMMVEQNRHCHNDGSGRMGQITTGFVAGATANIPVSVNQSIEGAAVTAGMADRYFEVGDRIAFLSPAGAVRNDTAVAGFYVVSIPDANTIQVAQTPGGAAILNNTIASLAAGDWIVRASNTALTLAAISTAFRAEPMGLAGMFHEDGVLDGLGAAGAQQTGSSDYTTTTVVGGTFQGLLATSANPFNRAVVLDNSGGGARPISEELLQQAISDAEERNNANVQLILSGYPIYNRYVGQHVPDKRYNNTLTLETGHKVLTFNGIMWVKDRMCYKNRVYLLDPDNLQVLVTEPLQPMAPFGMPQWERLHDTDDYWTGIVTSWQLATPVRERLGAVITELNA